MSDLLERHEKIGRVLGMALEANHPCMLDWAEIGFALKRVEALPARWREVLGYGVAPAQAANELERALGWTPPANGGK